MNNRINYNNDDDSDENAYDEYEGDEDDDEETFLGPFTEKNMEDEYLKSFELELAEQEIKIDLLKYATAINAQSFFWRFLSFTKRLSRITTTYHVLNRILNGDLDESQLDQ